MADSAASFLALKGHGFSRAALSASKEAVLEMRGAGLGSIEGYGLQPVHPS
jgi:hypothetical protein